MSENKTISSKIGRPRPLSPHLQIYKPQFSTVLSILHRASIVTLYFGVLALAFTLYDYAFFAKCPLGDWLKTTDEGQILTKIVLSGYALAASYWVCATIRHLVWDAGFGFDIKTAWRTAQIVMLATLVLTASIIYFAGIL